MHSQLGNVFFRMEVLDNEIDIYTPPITNTKSSILSKRNQHKKVRWEESIVDNEYKHTIRKAKHLEQLTQKLAKLQAKIIEQEDLIERQVGEVTRLTGLWARAREGEVPEGFELYATTFGTAKEANTAIQGQLLGNLLELVPKRCKLDMVLADIKVKANIYQNRVRIITSSMNPNSPSTTSCTCTEASEHRQFWTDNQNIETRQLSVDIPTKRSRLFHLTRLPNLINKKDNQKKSKRQSSIKKDPSSTTRVKEFNYNFPKRRLRRIKASEGTRHLQHRLLDGHIFPPHKLFTETTTTNRKPSKRTRFSLAQESCLVPSTIYNKSPSENQSSATGNQPRITNLPPKKIPA